jgi:hypothetical protein
MKDELARDVWMGNAWAGAGSMPPRVSGLMIMMALRPMEATNTA